MITIQDIDTSGVNEMFTALNVALSGTGQGGDLRKLVEVEGGQLAWEISNALGPVSKSKQDASIVRGMKSALSTKPKFENIEVGHKESSYAAFTWLSAGKNYLLGINDKDNLTDASVDEARKILRRTQKQPRGKRYFELGTRGKKGSRQHILLMNRARISQSTFNQLAAVIRASSGQLKASFAAAAAKLLPSKHIPGWVRAQIANVETNGKAIFDGSRLNSKDPLIEFGSRAPGVESNAKIRQQIQGALKQRTAIMKSKIEKLLAGYTYDWNTGRTFRSKSFSA